MVAELAEHGRLRSGSFKNLEKALVNSIHGAFKVLRLVLGGIHQLDHLEDGLDFRKDPANLVLKESLIIGGGCSIIHEYILPHFRKNVNSKMLKKSHFFTFFTFLPKMVQKCQI